MNNTNNLIAAPLNGIGGDPSTKLDSAPVWGGLKSLHHLLAAFILINSSHFANAQVLPTSPQPLSTCAVDPNVLLNWFDPSAITVNGNVVTFTANGAVLPANGLSFPLNPPNCIFYEWSWQMFLWLNSPGYAGAAGRVLDSPRFYGVSPLDQNGERTFIPQTGSDLKNLSVRSAQVGPLGRPVVFDKTGKMISIIRPQIGPNGKSVIRDKSGKKIEIDRIQLGRNGQAIFLAKSGKAIDVQVGRNGKPVVIDAAGHAIQIHSTKTGPNGRPMFLDRSGAVIDFEQGQALGNEALMAQNGSLVYYAIHVNDVYAYLLTGQKKYDTGQPGGLNNPATGFPTTQFDLDNIVQFAADKGKNIQFNSHALAVEVKSAWVETTGLDVSKYLTITAEIPAYQINILHPNTWIRIGSRQAQLALVGMHVVGSVKGHPEMIWATFEHIGNTPSAAYTYLKQGGGSHTVPASTTGNWLFATSGSTQFNVPLLHVVPGFIGPNIEQVSGTLGRSNTLRWKAWGAASDFAPNPLATIAASNTEIISINRSILTQLATGDVRKNYLLMGATWTVLGAPPSPQVAGEAVSGLPGQQVGTSSLTNTTMETYQQGGGSTRDVGTNCFSCHTGDVTMLGVVDQGIGKGLSHIYGPLKPLFP
ncbi:MAG TPA: hypothetical protein VF601_12445 [Beijerinckiaceae bacterium]|jgi:hypothetical protein